MPTAFRPWRSRAVLSHCRRDSSALVHGTCCASTPSPSTCTPGFWDTPLIGRSWSAVRRSTATSRRFEAVTKQQARDAIREEIDVGDGFLVLFTSQPIGMESMLQVARIAIGGVSAVEGATLLVKQHPNEDAAYAPLVCRDGTDVRIHTHGDIQDRQRSPRHPRRGSRDDLLQHDRVSSRSVSTALSPV